jgi:hypothetical protein
VRCWTCAVEAFVVTGLLGDERVHDSHSLFLGTPRRRPVLLAGCSAPGAPTRGGAHGSPRAPPRSGACALLASLKHPIPQRRVVGPSCLAMLPPAASANTTASALNSGVNFCRLPVVMTDPLSAPEGAIIRCPSIPSNTTPARDNYGVDNRSLRCQESVISPTRRLRRLSC